MRSTFGSTLAAIPARPAFFLLYFVTGTDELTDESKGELRACWTSCAAARRPTSW